MVFYPLNGFAKGLDNIIEFGYSRRKSRTMSLGLLLTATLALSYFSTIVFNSVIAQPTASKFTTAKELSIMLLKVKRHLPNASIVVGIIDTNGTQVYGYGNIFRANSTKVNGNTGFSFWMD